MKTVFLDVDTQLDFLYPAGALYVPGAEVIEPALADLTRFAAQNEITIISAADAHAEDDPEFKIWKPHCVAGTQGQAKSSATLLAKSLVLRSVEDLPSVGQIIVEKQQIDPFTNPLLPVLLDRLAADRFVVYGLVLEYCVKASLFGLLRRHASRVEFVAEVSRALNPDEVHAMLDRFTAEGGKLITLGDACRLP
jgi:nicotinamidase/pyrazinamidase